MAAARDASAIRDRADARDQQINTTTTEATKAELKSVYRSPPPNPARPGHMLAAKLGQHRHRLVLPPLSDIWGEADEADEADNIQL